MSPQRLLAQARAAEHLEPATLGAVIAIATGTVFTGVNVFLGALLLLAFIIDQLSGMLKAIVITPKGTLWFDGDKLMKGAAKKGLVVMAVIVAGSMDAALTYLPSFGEIAKTLSPITKTALVYFLIGQWTSALRNVAIVKEASSGVEFIMRRMDAAKLGHEPPIRREYDRAAVTQELTLPATDGRTFHEVVREIDANTPPSSPPDQEPLP